MNYEKKLFWLILGATMGRLILAGNMELGNSEVYYWVFSRHLQWNYFDHPPMVAWLIRLTTLNDFFHNELAVRIGSVICSGLCTIIIFIIGTEVGSRQIGWYAAVLYTSCYYSSIAAGVFILPDSPQLVYWLSSILFLLRILKTPAFGNKQKVYWCLFGLASGLCNLSKVHGIFLWLGVLLFAIIMHRQWFKNPWIYLSAIITFILVSPILIWNMQHQFATYNFHSNRVTVIGFNVEFSRFLKQLGGVALICNPINFFLICSGLWNYSIKEKQREITLILCCTLPLFCVILFVSLFREIYPHWPGPVLCTLVILPALIYGKEYLNEPKVLPLRFKWALGLMIGLTGIQIGINYYYPGTVSEEKTLNAGKGDPTLDMYQWKEAGNRFDSLYKKDVANKLMVPTSPIVVTNWYPAAHLDFYFADKTKQETIGIGNIEQLHQYYWLNYDKRQLTKGENAYYILPSNLFDYKAFDRVTSLFTSYDMPLTIEQYRSGLLCRQIYVFRVKGFRGVVQDNHKP